MALTTTASAGVVPPSPPARMPSGLVGDGTSLIAVVNDGQVVGARHRVVHERAGQHLAARRVVVAVLQQRLADALHDAAMGLAVQDQRVDRAADVVDRRIARRSRPRRSRDRPRPRRPGSRRGSAPHLHRLVALGGERAAQIVGQVVARARRRRDLEEADRRGRCPSTVKRPPANSMSASAASEQVRGDAACPCAMISSVALPMTIAGHAASSGPECEPPPTCTRSVSPVTRRTRSNGTPSHSATQLREAGLVALAARQRADHHLDAAVRLRR